MKIIKQTGIIFTICWSSIIIQRYFPLPIPASVIGLILLFLCLITGVLKISHIQEKSDFLLSNMAFFFIPAGVNVINYLDILRASWLPLLVICLVTMVITFAATALSIRLTVQLLHKKEGGRKHE